MIVILKVKEIEFLYSINSMPAECLGVLAGTMGYRNYFLSSLLLCY
jgi:hypothetical protein